MFPQLKGTSIQQRHMEFKSSKEFQSSPNPVSPCIWLVKSLTHRNKEVWPTWHSKWVAELGPEVASLDEGMEQTVGRVCSSSIRTCLNKGSL